MIIHAMGVLDTLGVFFAHLGAFRGYQVIRGGAYLYVHYIVKGYPFVYQVVTKYQVGKSIGVH